MPRHEGMYHWVGAASSRWITESLNLGLNYSKIISGQNKSCF